MKNANELIRIEVTDEPLTTYAAKADPKTGMMRPPRSKQPAYVHQGAAYPVRFLLNVDNEVGPLRPGMYLMAGGVFSPGEWDSLKFRDRELTLIPVADAVKLLAEDVSKPKLAAAS